MIGRLGRGRGLLPQRWRDRLLLALGRDLHVRRSELDRTLRTAGLACLLGCALYTAFSGAQAIFLEHAGASRYPLFFVILALTVWPGVALTVAANRRWGIGRAFRYNLLLNALAGVAIYVSYRVAENAVVSFIDYEPRPALRKVKVPVLALNGALDLQVPVDMNLPAIERI